MSDRTPIINNIEEQLKKLKDKVTAEEWNHIINTLAYQANENAKVIIEVEEAAAEILNNIPQTHVTSVDEPTDPNVRYWYRVLEDTPDIITTILSGGVFDEVPINILLGGTFDEVPTDILLGGSY